MRISFFILLTLLLATCGTSKFQKQLDKEKRLSEKEFTVVSSEIKSWVGGIKGAKGYSLIFKVIGNNLDKIVVDSVWFSENKGFRPTFEVSMDTLTIKGSYSESNNIVFRDVKTGKTKSAVKTCNPPISYEGNALIRTYLKGDEKYFIVDSLVDITKELSNEFK